MIRYARLRSSQGDFGSVSESQQPSTIAATRSPNCARISSRRARPPVLHRIVEQPRDRLVLVSAVFDHEGAHGQHVCDVRDGGVLAHLRAMKRRRVGERDIEPRGEHRPLSGRYLRVVAAVGGSGRIRRRRARTRRGPHRHREADRLACAVRLPDDPAAPCRRGSLVGSAWLIRHVWSLIHGSPPGRDVRRTRRQTGWRGRSRRRWRQGP